LDITEKIKNAAKAAASAAGEALKSQTAAGAAGGGDDIRAKVVAEFKRIPEDRFNTTLPIVGLEAALIPTLKMLGAVIGTTDAEIQEDAEYMAKAAEPYNAKERQSMIWAMIIRSMNHADSKFIKEGKLPAADKRPPVASISLRDKVGKRSNVLGGFGKPASAKRPRFEKGSEAAKAFMAQLRAKRRK
jgi:hypothetical protein